MPQASRIYLIGFMGVGKTTLGKKLANKLAWNFLDLDKYIEQESGLSIPQIFKAEGEDHFRELEAKFLRQTSEFDTTVIATGGGAPCFNNNMDWMNQHGLTVYLEAEPAFLASRLRQAKDERPLLEGIDDEHLQRFVEEKLTERIQFYLKAKKRYSGLRQKEILGEIVKSLR